MRQVFYRGLRFIVTCAVLMLIYGTLVVGVGYAAFQAVKNHPSPIWIHKEEYYRRASPDEIGVTSMVFQGSDASMLIALAFWNRMEACGGFAFKLSDDMVAELGAQGIARLREAKVGRGYPGNPSFEPWRPTPLPASWMGDGRWAGNLGCLIDNDRSFDARAVRKAAHRPGSYFTRGPESELLVIPELKLVVYTYHD